MKKNQPKKDNYRKVICVLLAVIIIETVFLIASFQRKEMVVLKQDKASPVKKALSREKPVKPQEPQIYKARIAIVLDDWGYNLNNAAILKEIKEPLTLAILPRRAYSFEVASLAGELKKEVILHLPMEPYQEKKYRLEPDTILIGMSKPEIVKILEVDSKSVPGIKGVSNHMGSQATESEALMKIIFQELKKRKLYFLDSFTGKTVCARLADEIGLPYARRHVFLDNKNDPEYIMAQIETLARIALREGYAVGIGHDRRKTLEALAKAMPELKRRGFKFVSVSDLVK